MLSVIKSETQYREVLARVENLVRLDPDAESDEGRELEVLSILLREYEREFFPVPPASPLAAIRLRMDQMGMAPKDLVPFLGSRSKVSEVLGGSRPLSLSMIRALHGGLKIPLETLVSDVLDESKADSVQWDRFPIRELLKRGWLELTQPPQTRLSFDACRELMQGYFAPVGGLHHALLQKKDQVRTGKSTDSYALAAWAGEIRRRAARIQINAVFNRADWDMERFRELRSLSRYDVGPRLAMEYLADRGIVVVIAPHLPRTRLDGAAMLRSDGAPVIGLTLRHDRLDNFWFTLFHEMMHVVRHLTATAPLQECFVDDVEVRTGLSELEKEADDAANEALLSANEWESSAARFVAAPPTIAQLARQLGISEAIIAGRIRHDKQNWRLLSSMVGNGKVSSAFPDLFQGEFADMRRG